MKNMDKLIKLALKEELAGQMLEKSVACPSEMDLAGFVSNSLPQTRRNEIEEHIADCAACMEDVVLAKKASDMENKTDVIQNNKFQGWFKKNIYIILAITCFVLSFVLSQYFVQLLVATIILAGKWIFDTINARILIMIYDAWKKGGEGEVGKVMEKFQPTRSSKRF